ncbi:M20/M25/M40 family metallo-hydrolase [Variovorax sp. E3]|uniref:M20/M25/M40 family metallo-hydrolase n=1 Tax=Variovorax sp. E3 TaxID=1914993 RepID=UPI0018DBC64C|nr:M20/M25/M40 family metallo-hydrolase [Variovorax sp. E3]
MSDLSTLSSNATAAEATEIESILELTQRLIATPSENPGGDTIAIAAVACHALTHPAIEIETYEPKPGCVNVVARVHGAHPGPRLVMNGHLDTYPVGAREFWTQPPLDGLREGDRIYGRGAGDMCAGDAVLITVLRSLADRQEQLHGEAVLTLVADEETGGRFGSAWLIDNVEHCRGDFVVNADAGHPRVVRYGEKGVMWLRLNSLGKAAHGAHTHLGDNALDSLMAAVQAVQTLRNRECVIDPIMRTAMHDVQSISEQVGGKGEYDNLCGITVNAGAFHAGLVPNLVPGSAEAMLDVRFPGPLSIADIKKLIGEILEAHPKVTWEVMPGSATEPAFTDPNHPLVLTFLRHARALAYPDAVANMRIGLTDTRLFRLAGMPAVVYGPCAHGLGGPDEYVTVQDVLKVYRVHRAVAEELLGLQGVRTIARFSEALPAGERVGALSNAGGSHRD